MEQVGLRGVVTQLAVMTWQRKFDEANSALEAFCAENGTNPFVFSRAELIGPVRARLRDNKKLLLGLLRELSRRRSNYITQDAIDDFFRECDSGKSVAASS